MGRGASRAFQATARAAVTVSIALFAACGAQEEGPRPAYKASATDTRLLTSSDGASYLAHEVIVRPQPDMSTTDFEALVKSIGATVDDTSDPAWPYRRLLLPQTSTADEAIAQLMAMGLVASAERNYLAVPFASAVSPNDPRLKDLWGLTKIGAPAAWSHGTGSHEVLVAISDTGIDHRHPDLAGNIWTNPGEIPGNGVDDDKNGYVDDVHGWDWVGNDGNPLDESGHGTHVAGTVGAVGNDGVGVVGVNWKVKLAALRFLGPSGGTLWNGAQTVLYAPKIKARIVNASWGCIGPSCYADYMQSALVELGKAGGLFVAAAGNNSSNNDGYPVYPANYAEPNVVSVAATGSNDELASFSNYGATRVHLGAPGVSILSTVPNGGYASYQGTSMAAPHVAGVAALLLSLRPGLSVGELKQRLLSTADKVPALSGRTVTGGRLNAHAAVLSDAEPPPVPNNVRAQPGLHNDITVQWDAVTSADLGGYRVQWGTTSGTPTQSQDVAANTQVAVIAGLQAGTRYHFIVRSVDRWGNVSVPSAEVSAVAQDATAPPQVIDLSAAAYPGHPVIAPVTSASGQYSAYWAATRAADGNPLTAWLTPGRVESQEEHVVLQLATPTFIDRVELLSPSAYPEFFPVDYDIEVSEDGHTWNVVGGHRNVKLAAGQWQHVLFAKVQAAAVRVRVLRTHVHESGYGYAGLAEVLVREVSSRPDGVEVRFTAPGDDPGQGTAARYDLRVSDQPLTSESFDQAQTLPTPTPAVAGTTEIVLVHGLAAGQTQYLALRAIDDAGNVSPLSNVATVKPLAVPPGAIADLRVLANDGQSLTLGWTAPGSDGQIGRAAAYELRVSAAPITAGNVSAARVLSGLPPPQTAGSPESFVVEGLAFDDVHYLAIRAFDEGGTPGAISNVISARLESGPDTTAPAPVNDLGVYLSQQQTKVSAVVDSVSSSVSTSLPASRLLDGNVDSVWISAAGNRTRPEWVVLDLGAVRAVTRLRMNPGNVGANLGHYPQAFEWQASADKQNWQPLVNVQAHKGQLGHWDEWSVPPTSTRYVRLLVTERGLQAGTSGYVWLGELEAYARTTEERIDLTWVAPGDDAFVGTAVAYELRHSTFPLTDANFAQAEIVSTALPGPGGTVELLTLPPLDRESRHHYRLRAFDDAGNVSELSNEAVIETAGVPPAAISDLAVTSAERNAVTLSFTATGDDGLLGTATAYELRYSTQPITADLWDKADTFPTTTPGTSGTRETVRVTGLASNTRYHFLIKVVDDVGQRSLPSNHASADTLDGIAPAEVTDLAAEVVSGAQSALRVTEVASSGDFSPQTAVSNLFDDDPSTPWLSEARAEPTNETVDFTLPAGVALHTLKLIAAPGYEDLFPSHFRFQVRDDESEPWRTLIEQFDFATSGDWEEWALGQVAAKHARLEILQTRAWAASHYAAVGEVVLLSETPTTSQLQLRWTAPGDDGHAGQAAAYDLRQANAPLSSSNFGGATPVPHVPAPALGGSLERLAVSALQPKTTYCFALRTTDDVGLSSGLSNSACATTAALPPGTVSDLRVTSISASGASLAWTAPGAEGHTGQNTTYDLRYSRQRITATNWDAATPVPVTAPGPAGQAETASVTGLSGLTTYFFAIRARNESGVISAVSNNAEARTLDSVPPSAVSNLSAAPIAARSGAIRVSFSAPGDNGPVGQAARYDLRVATLAITSDNFSEAAPVPVPSPRPAGSVEVIDIDNLAMEAAYFVALRSFDAAGNASALSNVVAVRTREEPPAAVSDLTVIGGRGTEGDVHLVLQWSAPGDNGGTGTAKAYDVRYATSPITATNFAQAERAQSVPAPLQAGTLQTFKLTGLQPDLRYYVALQTVDARDNVSPLSNVASAATPDEWAPARITDLGAGTGTNRGSVVLTWTAPGDDGASGKAAAYEVRYALQPLTEATFGQGTPLPAPAPPSAGTRQLFTATGLPDEALVHFAIRARDNAGNVAAISNSASARTPEVPPSAITTLSAVARSQTSITLRWLATGDNATAGTASAYDLRVSESPITADNFASARRVEAPAPLPAGTAQTTEVAGLSSTRLYHFALKAIDARGNGSALSNVLSAETQDDVPPARIADLVATGGSTAGSVLLSFTAPGDDGTQGKAAVYDVRYASEPLTSATFDAAKAVTVRAPATAGTLEQLTITNLKGESTFHFAMRAIDDAGLAGELSPSVSARTRPVAPAAVLDLQALAKPGAALLTWTAPGDDGHEGQAVRYDLRYSTQAITPQNFEFAHVVTSTPAPAAAGTPQSIEVGGLAEGTNYHFALKTLDDAETWSGISNIAQATTPDVTAPAAPQSLVVKAPEAPEGLVLPRAAQASSTLGPAWDASHVIDGNPMTSWASAPSGSTAVSLTIELEAIKHVDRVRMLPDPFYPKLFPRDFVIETSTNKTSWQTVAIEEEFVAPPANADDRWITWGFAAHQVRYVRLTAHGLNSSQGKAYALLSEIEVEEAAYTDGRAVLSWVAPGDDGMTGKAASYEVYRSRQPFTTDSLGEAELVPGAPSPAAPGSLQSFTVSGLEGETTYHWAVRAVDEAKNAGPLTTVVAAATNHVAPATVDDLRARLIDAHSVRLEWTAPGDDHRSGRATSYELRQATHSLSSNNVSKASLVAGVPAPKPAGAAETFTVSGLQLKEVYRFALVARDESGNTSYLSNVAAVATPSPVDQSPPATISDLHVRLPSEAGVRIPAKVVAFSSAQAPGFPAAAATDGRTDTSWASLPRESAALEWVRLDLAEAVTLDRVQLWASGQQPELFPRAVEVAVSPDGLAWTVVAHAQDLQGSSSTPLALKFPPQSARFVEVRATELVAHGNGLHYAVVAEVEVMTGAEPPGTFYAGFTAPSDDDPSGRAARYELALGTCPFSENAITLLTTSEPQPAGSPERFRFTEIPTGRHCVAVRSADAANNLSAWSSPVELQIP